MPTQLQNGGLLLVRVLLLCGIAGCLSAQSEDEHVEHHVPEHKPKSYAAAVDQVRLRHQRNVEEFQSAPIDSLKRELAEMNDIIGWLPELAADGPMKKPAWDQANGASHKLASIYRSAAAGLTTSTRGAWPGDQQVADVLIESLARQIPLPDDMP